MDLTPEECFERAMKLLERGKLKKAIKLLQIATLRAPGDARYREALQTARTLREREDDAPAMAAPAPAAEEASAPSSAPLAEPPQPGVDAAEAERPMPTSLADASPEAIYEQAMLFQAEGKPSNAARMLQIAIAKAPSEARFREALEAIRRPQQPASTDQTALDEQLQRAKQMSNFDEVERLLRESLRNDREQPERLLMLSLLLFRIRDDAKGALGPIRDAVRLAPKRLSALVLQGDILEALGDRTEAAKAAQAIREISTDKERLAKARQRLDDIIPSRQQTSAEPASSKSKPAPARGRQVALLGVLAFMFVVMGALYIIRQPSSIDTGPYSDQLPVISAVSAGGRDLIIRIDENKWGTMSRDEQASRLRGAMATASQEGFEGVFVQSSSDQFLGSIRGGQTFLPEK